MLFHLLRGTKDEKIRAKVEEFFEERQTGDIRRKKAVAVLKKTKMEKGVKEFIQERSHSEKDIVKMRNVFVFDISGLYES